MLKTLELSSRQINLHQFINTTIEHGYILYYYIYIFKQFWEANFHLPKYDYVMKTPYVHIIEALPNVIHWLEGGFLGARSKKYMSKVREPLLKA